MSEIEFIEKTGEASENEVTPLDLTPQPDT
jgi:hypothetical protein